MTNEETIFNKNKGLLYWLIIIISIAIIYSIVTITNNTINPVREISFNGKAEKSFTPDVATLTINLSEEGKTTKEAEEKLRAKAEKLFTSFDELEIEEKDIKTTNIYSQPKYSYPSCGFYGCEQPTILGYTHNESIAVKVRNIDNISKLTTLVSDNKIGSYYGPNWEIDNIEKKKSEVRLEAIKDARIKAEELTEELGLDILSVVSYWENNGYDTPISFNRAESVGIQSLKSTDISNNISAGQEKITSDVNVTFRVK